MKLYRFRYSPYARKVQMVLDLAGATYQAIEVPYVNRDELAALTGGYVLVPVLVDDDGKVIVESREICAFLLRGEAGDRLVPAPFEGPIWAYADFVDGPLEDVLFRLASPYVRDTWPTAWERGLYVFIKERKFGAGCVDTWEQERETLLSKARKLLAPTLSTLERQPFLFGSAPTLADAALYGVGVMLEEAHKELPAALDPRLPGFLRRVEAARPSRR
jgi:glutathione S-transferase